MYRIEIRDLFKILIVLLIYRSVATERQELFSVTYWDKYIYGIICCIIIFVAIVQKNKFLFPISKLAIKISIWLLLPVLVAWLYSLFVVLINPIPFDGFMSRSFSNVMFPLLSVIQGLMLYSYFDDEAVDIVFFAYGASFITSIVVAFINGGITQFALMIFDSRFTGSVLEMSELTPAFCLFLMYYLYQYRYRGLKKSEMLIRVFICLFILIIGMKRILILSTGIIILLYLFLNRKINKIKFWTTTISYLLILFIYAYIYVIKSGELFVILDQLNINTMARMEFWLAIGGEYTFNPFFWGHGVGYTSKWMDYNWQSIGVLGLMETTGIHNDLLKYFIDLGFWGFFLYLYMYLKIITDKIGKYLDNKAALIYFLLMVFQILCWFTDNISTYHTFMWPFYLIVFSLILDVRKERLKIARVK